MDDRDQDRARESDGIDRLTGELRRIADLLESRIAPALERLAESGGGGDSRARNLGERSAIAAIRRALRAGDLRDAAELIADLEAEGIAEADLDAARSEFAVARVARIAELRSRLDASRQVNDHDAGLELEEELSSWLDPDDRRVLRAEVLKWLMGLLMKRMRGGTVQADVSHLAARIAERFGDTKEGASLRASLPTLRRSAGLCARCGEPYKGIDDACPRCLAPRHDDPNPPGPAAEAPEPE